MVPASAVAVLCRYSSTSRRFGGLRVPHRYCLGQAAAESYLPGHQHSRLKLSCPYKAVLQISTEQPYPFKSNQNCSAGASTNVALLLCNHRTSNKKRKKKKSACAYHKSAGCLIGLHATTPIHIPLSWKAAKMAHWPRVYQGSRKKAKSNQAHGQKGKIRA